MSKTITNAFTKLLWVWILAGLWAGAPAIAADSDRQDDQAIVGTVNEINSGQGLIIVDDMTFAVTPDTSIRRQGSGYLRFSQLRVEDRVRLTLPEYPATFPISLIAVEILRQD